MPTLVMPLGMVPKKYLVRVFCEDTQSFFRFLSEAWTTFCIYGEFNINHKRFSVTQLQMPVVERHLAKPKSTENCQRFPVSDLKQEHQIFHICRKMIIYLIIYLKL